MVYFIKVLFIVFLAPSFGVKINKLFIVIVFTPQMKDITRQSVKLHEIMKI